jgi:hypothetical protein
MVNNIKRDPFEIAGGLDDQKSFMALGGALASPSTPRSDQSSAALRQVLPRRAGRDWLVADAHGPLSTLTALSVVPEHKLRLCHDRDELTIRRCDARLPHHRSPPVSPTIRLPTGAALMKLVLLSIVAVRPPSVRFVSVPSAPNVSAKAMTAPPCSTAGRVQSSSRTIISATILSGYSADNLDAEKCRERQWFFR